MQMLFGTIYNSKYLASPQKQHHRHSPQQQWYHHQQQQQQQHPQQHAVVGLQRLLSTGYHSQQSFLAAAASKSNQSTDQKQPPSGNAATQAGSRNARLYELFDGDGWGVEAAPAAKQPQSPHPAAGKSKPQSKSKPVKQRKGSTPYANIRSQDGKLGLTLLQKALSVEEAEQQQQDSAAAPGSASSKPSMQQIRAQLSAAGRSSKRLKSKLPGFPKAGAAAAAGAAASLSVSGSDMRYGDGDEDWDEEEEDEATPSFEITFDERGQAAMRSFSADEDQVQDKASSTDADAFGGDLDDDFGMDGWGQFEDPAQPSSPPKGSGADADSEVELALLQDLGNEDDWGLESLSTSSLSGLQRGGRRSLVDELTAAEGTANPLDDQGYAGSVQWGGSAGTTGIDLEEQEALLTRYFRPDQVKRLMKEQQEVEESYSVLKKRAVGLGVSDHKLQEKLRIVSGSAAGRKLVSFKSPQTRPMMEKVRQAIFNMLQSRSGTLNSLPRTARWLDLFAGTGSVGLEALSRGVKEAHFVEMDPVVVSKVLDRNIKQCGFKGRAWTHTSKAEDFLRRSASVPRFAGGPFDFISVCPPYLLVSYPELFELLDASPLLHEGTLLFVEYPKQLSRQVVDRLGPLQRVRDRRYGRTWVALYAAAAGDANGFEGDDDGAQDPFLAMLS